MIQVLQLILALSFLVVIHEFGHFAFARIFGVRVDKFYMFFNYKFSLFRAKKFNGKWHVRFFAPNVTEDDEWSKHPETTEWGIGWIPFGGYCAIVGMVDETQDAAKLAAEKQPWEFRSKNVFQRFLIIAGGILVNFIAGLLIFGAVLFTWGEDSLPLKKQDRGLYFSQILLDEGFRQQDKILTIDGKEPEALNDVVKALIIEGKQNVTVLRGEDTLALVMSQDLSNRYLAFQNDFDSKERAKARADKSYQKAKYVLLDYFYPFVVDTVMPGSAAAEAGILKGDSLISIEGVETSAFPQVQEELRRYPCQNVKVGFYRDSTFLETTAWIGDQCKLGVVAVTPLNYLHFEHKDYSFLEAIPAGVVFGWNYLKMYIRQFRLVFSKEGAQSLGGFGAIGQMFPKVWDWSYFWQMTGILSIILAFMNFLPIPALDGGYLLFLLVEMITRKQPSDKFLENANKVGWFLLIALLIFANGNDLLKWLFI
ncbi:MAG: RIP metalloprotease RseP [Paludibacteraceae bacterium]|nr:RIP metalloprotease RseP [Paludibacteraceae bacterium]